MKFSKGFTLVEILIVVIILGILAAIVIPQFTQASDDARQSSLTSDLQTVRSQLELFKVQHLENYPDSTSGDTFTTALTSRSDADSTLNTAGKFGPYLQKFPANPYISGDAARQVTIVTENPAAALTTGWYFNSTTGEFHPGDAKSMEADL